MGLGVKATSLTAIWQALGWDPVMADVLLTGVTSDSRQVEAGNLFIACVGEPQRLRRFIEQAQSKQAAAVAVDATQLQLVAAFNFTVPIVPVPDLISNQGLLAASLLSSPSSQMLMVGVTGTNGKTSISHYVAQAYTNLQQPCGVIGTTGNGFLAALKAGPNTTPDAVTVQVLLEQMRAQGAAACVMEVSSHGLDKVDSLNTYQARRIPTLALNYLSADENQPSLANMADVDVRIQQHVARIDKPASANYIATQTTENPSQHTFFQFGLSLEDEARQLATQGHHQGLKQALIIHANTQWAQRVSDTFTQQWQHLGGKIAAKVSYTGNGDYADSISKVLLIDNSKQRRRDLQKLINNNVKFESRRRQDIDLIVLLGMPKDVRQLMPTLAFHHAAEVAVFATHHAYQGPTKTTRDRDLNKMYISDIPWMLEPDEVTHQVQATWPDRQRYSRLFALGADAYRLYPRLQQMQAFDATRVRGTTGLLKLDANNRITANLSWARFRNGQPVVRKGAHELQ